MDPASRSSLTPALAVRTLVRVEVAAIGFVGMTIPAAQDPDIGRSIRLTLPASALQQHLAKAVQIPNLDLVWNAGNFG